MSNKRNIGNNLNEWKVKLKPIKGTQGLIACTEEKAIGLMDNDQNNKNLIQYAFPFVSGVSLVGDIERGYIQEQLGDTAVKARIYCIRHGMSVQEKEGRKAQTIDTLLCKEAIDQYKENAEKLKNFGVNGENTYLLYCEETEGGKVVRITKSAGLIAEGIGIPPERILKTMSGLDTTDKDDDIAHRRISATKTISIDFAAQLLAKLGSNRVTGINIICIIHKSNIDGIQEGIFQNKEDAESHLPKMDEIKTGEMIFIDVDIAGRPLNYRKRVDILRFDQENYVNIFDALKGEEELQKAFNHFNSSRMQIWELQNYVNAYFKGKPELLEKFLSPEFPGEIRSFCLANLLRLKKYKTIDEFYSGYQCEILSSGEKVLIIQNIDHENLIVRRVFQRLLIGRPTLWKNSDQITIYKYLGQERYEQLLISESERVKEEEIKSEMGWSIINALLDNSSVDVNSDQLQEFFLRAVSEDKTEIVEKFIARNVNVNCKGEFGFTALHLAVSPEIIKILLRNKANPNACEDNGFIPLHGAIGRKHIESMRLLLDAGSDIFIKSHNGIDIFTIARNTGDQRIINLLEKFRLDIDRKNNTVYKDVLNVLQKGNKRITNDNFHEEFAKILYERMIDIRPNSKE